MLIAHTTDLETGTNRLVLGLETANLEQMLDDKPQLEQVGELIPELAGWEVMILGPTDAARFILRIRTE